MRPVAADRRPQDRALRRAGLQQLLPRRQARQRGRPAERRDAAARVAGHADAPKRAACRPGPRWRSIASGSRGRSPTALDGASPHHDSCAKRSRRFPTSSDRSPVILATGPLTSEALSADIARLVGGEHLYFYDAISPIVLAETIDRTQGLPGVALGSKPPTRRSRRRRPRRGCAAGRSGLRRGRWAGRLSELSVHP